MNQILTTTPKLEINGKLYKNPLCFIIAPVYISQQEDLYASNNNNSKIGFDIDKCKNAYLAECEFYEGDISACNFEILHDKFLKLQESLQPYGTPLDYIYNSRFKAKYGRNRNLIAKSQDEKVVWKIYDTYNNMYGSTNVLIINNKQIKLNKWLQMDSNQQKTHYESCFN